MQIVLIDLQKGKFLREITTDQGKSNLFFFGSHLRECTREENELTIIDRKFF